MNLTVRAPIIKIKRYLMLFRLSTWFMALISLIDGNFFQNSPHYRPEIGFSLKRPLGANFFITIPQTMAKKNEVKLFLDCDSIQFGRHLCWKRQCKKTETISIIPQFSQVKCGIIKISRATCTPLFWENCRRWGFFLSIWFSRKMKNENKCQRKLNKMRKIKLFHLRTFRDVALCKKLKKTNAD